jgi:peptidoglycan/xylan/chitin deacetylase (PgdA/CDA1 family)
VPAIRRRAKRDVLVLTFDDGYRDIYLRALPVLRGLGLPATVFVPTGYLGGDEPLLHDRLYALLLRARARRRDLTAVPAPRLLRQALGRAQAVLQQAGASPTLEALIESLPVAALRRVAAGLEDLLGERFVPDDGGRVLTADELRACAEGGIAAGAHTVDHVVLTHEPPARVRRELGRARRDLEAITGEPCTHFAWCNGLWNQPALEAVRAAGYTVAVTTRDHPNRPGVDPLLLGRKVMGENHVRGPRGFSEALAAAQLHDAFGALHLVSAADGERSGLEARGLGTEWRLNA